MNFCKVGFKIKLIKYCMIIISFQILHISRAIIHYMDIRVNK